jgi:glycosyltransferase involved in cell wall biosynthesis
MTIAAIIPAYNEEKNIGNVLEIVKQVSLLDRIIVVNDGSTDGTSQISNSMGVEVLDLQNNMGKGGAIKSGLGICGNAEIVLFLDGDLIGLQKSHITNLVEPVIKDYADMSVGVFKSGRIATDLAQWISPFLSGQRAVKKDMICAIPGIDMARYGVEIAMTLYLKKANARIVSVPLYGITHPMKEEKLGLIPGIRERFRMYRDIAKHLKL